jgi:hypothetical protein
MHQGHYLKVKYLSKGDPNVTNLCNAIKNIKLLYRNMKDAPSLPLAQAQMAVNSSNSFVSAYS